MKNLTRFRLSAKSETDKKSFAARRGMNLFAAKNCDLNNAEKNCGFLKFFNEMRARDFHQKLFACVCRLTIFVSASMLFPLQAARAWRQTADDEKPAMFVLQVGISEYKYHRKLSGVTDVLAMHELLTGGAYKIPRENIRTLCDDGAVKECDGAATKDNIVREFETHLIKNAREYFKKTGKQAIVVFEFSGHGSQVPDLDGDERDDHLDETLVTVDSQDAPGKNFDITDDEIYLLNSRLAPYTNNVIYILDSCTSGSGTRGAADAP